MEAEAAEAEAAAAEAEAAAGRPRRVVRHSARPRALAQAAPYALARRLNPPLAPSVRVPVRVRLGANPGPGLAVALALPWP